MTTSQTGVSTQPAESAAGTDGAPDDGRQRVVIEAIAPKVEGGRFPIKRVVGESVVVEADIFADGHDHVAARLLHRRAGAAQWSSSPMTMLDNDRWRGEFTVQSLGGYEYAIEAWIDRFGTWLADLRKKVDAEQDVDLDLRIGAQILARTAETTGGEDSARLAEYASTLADNKTKQADRVRVAMDPSLRELAERADPRAFSARTEAACRVTVDPPLAQCSAWYELFPRSCAETPGEHGTFRDVINRLPYIGELGFDIVYLPPIHPIGRTHRKGRNNRQTAEASDVGSPWAIGAEEGGHKSIHPELGTEEDFRALVDAVEARGMKLALDIAFQCSPDHPYVREHPEWFRKRPDGTIQYAENPPKKYQDIYPFDFECEQWPALWRELRSVFYHWIERGVTVFRVDNPHTKPFAFWQWAIATIKDDYPETIFLSEAFTRPKVMKRLAKVGFTQSYTYFAWKNTREDLTEYFTELTQTPMRQYFRPNPWPNTPDILNEYLQHGGRPAFAARLVLAATLAAKYGIYGPAFELIEHTPREPGSEEYLDSEKYQIRSWDLDDPNSLRPLITTVNRARREHPALQHDHTLRFHPTDNDELICYSKVDRASGDIVLVVVNLDPHHTQSGWVQVPLERFGLDPHHAFQVHDLLSGEKYMWHGESNYVELNPTGIPAHLFTVQRHARSERDFEHFL